MHAIVYTDTQESVYREEKNLKVISSESAAKASSQVFVEQICAPIT